MSAQMDPAVRNQIDETIRRLWSLFSDQTNTEAGRLALTDEDLELWCRVTHHPAIQTRLDAVLKVEQQHPKS